MKDKGEREEPPPHCRSDTWERIGQEELRQQCSSESWSQHCSSGSPTSYRNAGTSAALCSFTSWEQPVGSVATSYHGDTPH